MTTAPLDAGPGGEGPELVSACRRRTNMIVAALSQLDEAALTAASALPDWTRLTIACHLRYGASALHWMTTDALARRPTAYYPEGRQAQRPATLEPRPGESPADVVGSLQSQSEALDRLWAGLTSEAWATRVEEPAENEDLGTLPLDALVMLRLTEVEVHGSDLSVAGLGLEDWSHEFVQAALPFRLEWLPRRWKDRRPVCEAGDGSWLISASDGPTYLVRLEEGVVQSHLATPVADARASIRGSARDLLALILGRPVRAEVEYLGDLLFARAFTRVFPGP